MKKLIVAAACVAGALSGFAQGTMQFQNGNTSPIYINATNMATSQVAANKVTAGTIASMTTALGYSQTGANTSTGVIDIGLIWGTSAGTVNQLAAVVQVGATSGVIAGNPNLPVTGTNPGDQDWFQVAAWDSSYGNTLSGLAACVAAGGYWGSPGSTTYGTLGNALQFTLGPNPSPGTVMFGSPSSGAGLFHLFTLTAQTPEPATLALGGLGAAALLLFRRRK